MTNENEASPVDPAEIEGEVIDASPAPADPPAPAIETPTVADLPKPAETPKPPRPPRAIRPAKPAKPKPLHKVGDQIWIPGQGGKTLANVIAVYDSFMDGEKNYDGVFSTALQKHSNYDPNSYHYMCEVANPAKKRIAGCEKDVLPKTPRR